MTSSLDAERKRRAASGPGLGGGERNATFLSSRSRSVPLALVSILLGLVPALLLTSLPPLLRPALLRSWSRSDMAEGGDAWMGTGAAMEELSEVDVDGAILDAGPSASST
jgi:hypothetical protein